MAGSRLLWRARGFQQRVLLALDASEFLPQLAAHGLGNVEQNSAEFGEREQTEALPIVHRYHFQGGREELPSAFPNSASELLPLPQDQMGLHQGVGQQNHQRLIDHQREGAGMHPGEIPETLILPVPLSSMAGRSW